MIGRGRENARNTEKLVLMEEHTCTRRHCRRTEGFSLMLTDDKDSGCGIVAANPAGCRKPIHFGHFDIHHHPVGLVRCIGLDRLKSVRRFHRLPIFVRKNLPNKRAKFRVIVGDQNKGR